MEIIVQFFWQIVGFFMNNWIAAAVLALVLVVAIIKKPKELMKVAALTALLIGVLYIMIYLEKTMFTGVSSKERGIDIERQTK